MKKIQYSTINEYAKAVYILTEFTKIILISYTKCSNETRDIIIRNFVARSITSLNGMIQLWQAEDYHDCWLLYRAILDRLFYLESLGRNNTFEDFDSWCFKKRYKYKVKCLKDTTLVGKIDLTYFTPSEEDKRRYKSLKNKSTLWTQPKAHKVASSMNLGILYDYGYNFASMFVHPSATEGEEDYSRLVGIKPSKSYDDQITVVHNSCMVMNTIIKAGIFFSCLEWRLSVSKFVDDFMRYMAEGSNDYLVTFREVKRMVEMNLDLCQIKK